VETPEDHSVRYSAKEYFQLVDEGLISPDERVELLDGLIVAMSPQNPAHAATTWHVHGRLSALVGDRAIVRSQLPLLAGSWSVPEPDIAIVPPSADSWQFQHPDTCILAIEVADSSLIQDRLSKSRIYAAAGVENFWIVNLRSRRVEWFAEPDRGARVYGRNGSAAGDEVLPPTVFQLNLCAEDMFPPLRSHRD
jgi:Uma2 family endonuclease